MPWLLNLATRLLARSLNMPEPLVHSTGVFVFAQVQAVENSVGRTLCPSASPRRLLAWCRQARLVRQPPNRRTTMISSSQLLRRALLADAIFSGAGALAMALGRRRARRAARSAGGVVARNRPVPDRLYGAGRLARHACSRCRNSLVAIVIAGNAAWTIASIALLFSAASVSRTLLGEASSSWPRRLVTGVPWPSCNMLACAEAAIGWRPIGVRAR